MAEPRPITVCGVPVLVLGGRERFEGDLRRLAEAGTPFLLVTDSLDEALEALKALGATEELLESLQATTKFRRIYPMRTFDGNHVFALRIPPPHPSHKHMITLYMILSSKYSLIYTPKLSSHILDYLSDITTRSEDTYTLLANLVEDSLFKIGARLEAILDRIEDLESSMIRESMHSEMRAVLGTTRGFLLEVRRLRRTVYRYRDILEGLASKGVDTKRLSLIREYQLREVLELVEYAVNRIHDFLNINLSIQNLWLTDIMRVLTIISTIFIPITFITGLYGMNFNTTVSKWNMPELNYPYGYPLALAVMAVISAIMIMYFKRKKWV
jgi:Mg2+ and Co2+ transporter CorA